MAFSVQIWIPSIQSTLPLHFSVAHRVIYLYLHRRISLLSVIPIVMMQ